MVGMQVMHIPNKVKNITPERYIRLKHAFPFSRTYLTSTDTHRRCRATGLLSQVIRGLPEGCLNATEGKLIG